MDLLWTILLAAVALYVTSAILLFIVPTSVHHNHANKLPSLRLAAHRGGAGEFIENTMAAFDHCVQIGFDMLEIDVQETQDGVVVISHDNDMSRVTSSGNLISETLYEDLPLYNNNLPLQFDRVRCLSSQADLSFVKLDDLFEKHANVVVHIDTKEGTPSLIKKVASLVAKHDRFENTVWGNMGEAKNSLCYSENPNIAMFMSIPKAAITYLMFYLGMVGFLPMKEAVFDIPMPSTILRQYSDVLSVKQKVLGRVAGFLMMNRLVFWHLQRRGINVVLFVLNQEEDFIEASKYGVDGIMTDFPSRLSKFYSDYNSNEEMSKILPSGSERQ